MSHHFPSTVHCLIPPPPLRPGPIINLAIKITLVLLIRQLVSICFGIACISDSMDSLHTALLTASLHLLQGEGKGKAARRPPAQILSSKSAASPKKCKVIKQLLRSLTLHLHTGWKYTVPSRRCAWGFLCQWTRWAATWPSGRRCILGCMTRIISLNPPTFN